MHAESQLDADDRADGADQNIHPVVDRSGRGPGFAARWEIERTDTETSSPIPPPGSSTTPCASSSFNTSSIGRGDVSEKLPPKCISAAISTASYSEHIRDFVATVLVGPSALAAACLIRSLNHRCQHSHRGRSCLQ